MADVIRVAVLVDAELWKVTAPVLEAAVKKAYGRKRTVEWVQPDSLEDVKLSLHGPGGAPHRLEGLTRREVRFGAGEQTVRLVHPLAQVETLEGPSAGHFLSVLRRRAPHLSRRLRFATRERVEAHLRSRGVRESPVVDAVVSLTPSSLGGFVGALLPAVEGVLDRNETRALLIHDETLWSPLESAVDFHAFQVLPATLGDRALTAWALDRLRETEGDAAAEEIRAEAERSGAVFLDFATLDDVLPRLLGAKETARTFVATAQAAVSLEPVLAHQCGGGGASASFDREGTRAAFESRSGEGLAQAAALMFEHVGWGEAAQRVRAS